MHILLEIRYLISNYTLYKNPGFWLVNSRCIFRVNSYLGFISFIFTAAGVFAWGFNCFTLACIKPPNAFGICLLYLYTQSNVINQIWNPEVFQSKGFNLFPSAVVFAKTYFTFLPSRAANRQIHSENFNDCLTKTNQNTTTVPAEGNSSKRPIVFNNCQVTNNEKKNNPGNDKQKVLFI